MERRLPPRRDVIMILTAGLGILLVAHFSPQNQPGHDDSLGITFGMLCGLFYSFYLVLNRCMSSEVQMMQRLYWQSAAGTLVLLVPLMAGSDELLQGISSGWPWLVGIGILQGVGVLALVAYAMRHLTSLEFGIISCLEPTEATMLGRVVYSEVIMPGQWPGFVLVFATILAKSQRHLGWKLHSLLARRTSKRRRARA